MRKYFFLLVLSFGIVYSAEVLATEPKLEGITYDKQNPKESLALLNGQLLKAGQTIEDYEVMSVGTLEVQLKNIKSGQTTTLNMNKEFEKSPPKSQPAKIEKKEPAGLFNLDQKKVKKENFYSNLIAAAQRLMPATGPAGEYQKFMDAVFRGNFGDAKTFVEPNSPAASLLRTKSANYNSCVAKHGRRFSHASYQTESETKNSDTEIELRIIQTVRGDVPGVTSAYGVTAVLYSHRAVMVEKGDGWKVKSFQYKSETLIGHDSSWLCVD